MSEWSPIDSGSMDSDELRGAISDAECDAILRKAFPRFRSSDYDVPHHFCVGLIRAGYAAALSAADARPVALTFTLREATELLAGASGARGAEPVAYSTERCLMHRGMAWSASFTATVNAVTVVCPICNPPSDTPRAAPPSPREEQAEEPFAWLREVYPGLHDHRVRNCAAPPSAAPAGREDAPTPRMVTNILKDTTGVWTVESKDHPQQVTCHSRVVGGVLCRWWGDGPAPSGVTQIDVAAHEGAAGRSMDGAQAQDEKSATSRNDHAMRAAQPTVSPERACATQTLGDQGNTRGDLTSHCRNADPSTPSPAPADTALAAIPRSEA